MHSKYLVHWTGRDFHPPRSAINTTIRKKYLERLRSIVKNGFLMNRGQEEIWDHRGRNLSVSVSRVCFTEVRLSAAEQHAATYGFLGIGVSREFVLDFYGNPVFYQYSGAHNYIAENSRRLLDYLKKNNGPAKELRTILSFCKNMNDHDSKHLAYYNELEWRIVYSSALEKAGRIKVVDKKQGLYCLPLRLSDIQLIVLPDAATRKMAAADRLLEKIFRHCVVVTLDDCGHF